MAIFHFKDHYLRENPRLDKGTANKRAVMIIDNEVIIGGLQN